MGIAIRIARTGAPDVLETTRLGRVHPGANEVWLEHEAIGVNYLDVMQRQGSVAIPLPNGLGLEGAGVVAAVGTQVRDLAPGDRVGYILGPLGSYSSGRLYPAERLLKLPDDVGCEDAAAVLFKGITAQYLLTTTFPVRAGHVVLLYGAAGALGQLLAPWAKALGAHVIGVVSKPSSIERARAAGCDNVLVWGVDLQAEVKRLTRGAMADVVYDGVGRLTLDTSLDCLRPRGMLVSIGASSGAPAPVNIGTLNAKGSLFLTRPGLAAHATDIAEYRRRAQDVFDNLRRGVIHAAVSRRFPLAQAALAHAALENGTASGAIVLRP